MARDEQHPTGTPPPAPAASEQPTSPVSRPLHEDTDAERRPDLTDIGTLRRLLIRHGMHPSKSFGQHLLISRRALEAVIKAARLTTEDHVLEVGAGPGVLTVELAERVQRVVAVELDRTVLPALRETTASYSNVEIIARDLLRVDPAEVFGVLPYKLVANLPYYITSLTLRHFLEATNRPRLLVVMVQREVAERMVAGPGNLSLLALSVQFYGTPRIVAQVPATAFYPPPKVDSAIVQIEVFAEPLLPDDEHDRFFAIAHAGFAEKRKQIHNSLARQLGLSAEVVSAWLAGAEIEPTRRPATLSLPDWLRLTQTAPAGAALRPGGELDAIIADG